MFETSKRRIALLALFGLLIVAVAVGAANASSSHRAVSRTASSKTVIVGTDATYPPFEYVASNGTTITGLDVDLMKAIAKASHVKIKIVTGNFDGLVAGLQAGKYGASISAFEITKAREQAVDMVGYFKAGDSIYANANVQLTNKGKVSVICGHTVALLRGINLPTVTNEAKACTATTTIVTYPDQASADQAVIAGRADMTAGFTPVAKYTIQHSKGKLVMAALSIPPVELLGIAAPKHSKLTKKFQHGLVAIKKNGKYHKILKKWNELQGAVTKFQVNPKNVPS